MTGQNLMSLAVNYRNLWRQIIYDDAKSAKSAKSAKVERTNNEYQIETRNIELK